MSKTVTVSMDGFLYLNEFSNFINIDRVVFYNLKVGKNKALKIKFYDKNKKIIRPYATK